MLLHKVCSPQILTLHHWPVPINLHDKHCACNIDGTETDGRRREELVNCYRKQQELKFTFRTEQCNSSFFQQCENSGCSSTELE